MASNIAVLWSSNLINSYRAIDISLLTQNLQDLSQVVFLFADTATDWTSTKTELEKFLETATIILWINERVIQALVSAMVRTDEKGIKQEQDTFWL